MFNIKRYDPSQPSTNASTSNAGDGMDELARKIQQRKNKRKANEAGLHNDEVTPTRSESTMADQAHGASTSTSISISASSAPVGEWQPPPGESPAEREKRLKREKRAAKFGYDPYARPEQSLTSSSYNAAQPPSSTSTSVSAPPAPVPSSSHFNTLGEWQPAPGESPAEREKRIKREKRAARLGLPSPGAPTSVPTSGWNASDASSSHFIPPPAPHSYPSSYTPMNDSTSNEPPTSAAGLAAIHPDRLAAPALAKAVKSKKPQEKTPARLRYLKQKKLRAKGRKRGMKKDGTGTSDFGTEAGTEAGSEDEDDQRSDEGEGSGDEHDEEKTSLEEEKRRIVMQKKAERKAKRDEKKAEIRRLKAEGKAVPAPQPRIVAPKPAPILADGDTSLPLKEVGTPTPTASSPAKQTVEFPAISAEPTEEEIEAEKEEEARLARKEAKRQKRAARRQSKPEADESMDVEGPMLIPTGANETSPVDREPTPDVDIDPIPQPREEAAPLLRLPSATRPAPPSKKTLSDLNVHESVRNKRVVDPEIKIKIDDEALGGVSERGRKRLIEMGITEAFAVQTEVLPILLPSGVSTNLYSPFRPPRDLCVSAPTGSGKTLSYVVPIVETLAPRIVTRLRALVILPTRDLVGQVRETFEAFGKGLGLKIGIATGQHSFSHEQASLVGENVAEGLQGGSSLVDILIATPGRLMDHVRATPGFSLQHSRYLVVDEADRLLTQSFNDWLPSILTALNPPPTSSSLATVLTAQDGNARADVLAPAWWDAKIGRVDSEVDVRASSSCQKLLFSATLSRDPAKIDALHLHRPIYVSVEDALDPHAEDEAVDGELKFTFPAHLSEHMIVSPATHKPLYLLHLLHTVSLTAALCFTKSVEAANRLAKLVEFFEASRIARQGSEPAAEEEKKLRPVVKAYSSDLPPAERNRLLTAFKKGEIQMLICSDLISRGIDLPSVSHVISYDIPADVRKYVHRVGRTARAGNAGDAWSLVEDQEVAPFKAMMKAAQHWDQLKRVRVKDSSVEGFVDDYEVALERLKKHFATGSRRTEGDD